MLSIQEVLVCQLNPQALLMLRRDYSLLALPIDRHCCLYDNQNPWSDEVVDSARHDGLELPSDGPLVLPYVQPVDVPLKPVFARLPDACVLCPSIVYTQCGLSSSSLCLLYVEIRFLVQPFFDPLPVQVLPPDSLVLIQSLASVLPPEAPFPLPAEAPQPGTLRQLLLLAWLLAGYRSSMKRS